MIRFRIPSTLKIKGKTYKVKLVKDLKDDGVEVLGLHDHENQVISINSCTKGRERRQVFFHEYFHAYIYECGLREGIDSQMEEVIVDALAQSLEENGFDTRYKGTAKCLY